MHTRFTIEVELGPKFTAEGIVALRESLSLTQEQFCALYGFSLHSLKSWESGRRNPRLVYDLLLRMIKANPETAAKLVRRIK